MCCLILSFVGVYVEFCAKLQSMFVIDPLPYRYSPGRELNWKSLQLFVKDRGSSCCVVCVAVMRLHKPCCSDVNAGELEIIEQKFKSFSIAASWKAYLRRIRLLNDFSRSYSCTQCGRLLA